MSKTHQLTILDVLYEAGFHFNLKTNSITIIDALGEDDYTIEFLFDTESEELIEVKSTKND